MAKRDEQPKKMLHVQIGKDLMDAIESYSKDKGCFKRFAVESLLRKALGPRVQQQQLFKD